MPRQRLTPRTDKNGGTPLNPPSAATEPTPDDEDATAATAFDDDSEDADREGNPVFLFADAAWSWRAPSKSLCRALTKSFGGKRVPLPVRNASDSLSPSSM